MKRLMTLTDSESGGLVLIDVAEIVAVTPFDDDRSCTQVHVRNGNFFSVRDTVENIFMGFKGMPDIQVH